MNKTPVVFGFLLCASMALNMAFMRKLPWMAIVAGVLYAAALWYDGR